MVKDKSLARSLRRLSKALGHKPGTMVDVLDDETIEAALVRIAAERIERLTKPRLVTNEYSKTAPAPQEGDSE